MKNIINNNDIVRNIDMCSTTIIHNDIVKTVKKDMLDEYSIQQVADLLKLFGDSTRIKIIYALFKSEMCVCDIAAVLEMNQSAISHQLRVLKQARLVKYRREGKVVYYSLDDDHIKDIFDTALNHVNE